MKKGFLLLMTIGLFAFVNKAMAQQGEGISYQGAIRNGSGVVANTPVNLRFSILQYSTSGTAVYVETQMDTTTSLGLINATIGAGTASTGTWKNIPWNQGPFFIHVEVDPAGGTSFTDLGTTQLASVPFAKQSNGVTLFQSGTQNPNHMIITHSPSYPGWGLRYNDTLDAFQTVAYGGSVTATTTLSTGDISSIGDVSANDVVVSNKVKRGSDTTNMLPIAWGNINGTTGAINTGSGNFSVVRNSVGNYSITINGENYFYAAYAAIVSTSGLGFIKNDSVSNNLLVFTYNTSGVAADHVAFQFVVYKK